MRTNLAARFFDSSLYDEKLPAWLAAKGRARGTPQSIIELLNFGGGNGVARAVKYIFKPLDASAPISKAEHEAMARSYYDAYKQQVAKNRAAIDPARVNISGMGVPREMLKRAKDLLDRHSIHWIAAHSRATGYASRGLFKGVYVGFDE